MHPLAIACLAASLACAGAPAASAGDETPAASGAPAAAPTGPASYARLQAALRGADTSAKLRAVNLHFNRFAYRSDRELWSRDDYWATPVEFAARRGGDCEDFAIAKYFALIDAGVDARRLFLTYARVVGRDAPHMVLTYYPSAKGSPDAAPLVLDSFVDEVLPTSRRRDLARVFEFNADGAHLVRRGARVAIPTRDRDAGLHAWRDLLARVAGAAGAPVRLAALAVP